MTAVWVMVVVAIAGGASVALQAQLAGLVDERLGTLEAIFVTYGLGGVLAGLAILAARGGSLGQWRTVPPYAFAAGLFGLVIVGAISFSVARLGVVRALLLITVAQFVVSTLIDHFGLLGAQVQPVTAQKLAGIVLLLVGGWLVLR